MLRVLLAEDNPGDITLVREAFRTAPVPTDLVIAENGEQALHHLRGSKFDLVILDLNIPKRDGQTILQLCAAADAAPPFVIFSSSHRYSDRELALMAGAKEYVTKPADLGDFIAAVHGLIAKWGIAES